MQQSDEQYGPNMSQLRANTRRMKKRAARRRACTMMVILVIALACIAFLTPVFDIQYVDVIGLERTPTELVETAGAGVKGQNLFTVSTKSFENVLCDMPYIKAAHTKRHLIPPSLEVTVTERTPAAYIACASGFVLIDGDLIVLEASLQPPTDLPKIVGAVPTNTQPGTKMTIDEGVPQAEQQPAQPSPAPADTKPKEQKETKEGAAAQTPDTEEKITIDETKKSDIIELCIRELERFGADITTIDVSDTKDIMFMYCDRLRVTCGSSLDLEEKLKLFTEVINSNRLASNARGSVDLSNTGRAVYSP